MKNFGEPKFSEGGRGNRTFPRIGKQAFAESNNIRNRGFLRSGVSGAKRSHAATIGIPRALIYWKEPVSTGSHHGYFWKTFFENLGVEVILSPQTNKEIIEKGVKIADPETCFATKVFFGHLLWLEGKCDKIFVPRLKTSEEKLEFCPRFFGLPDLAKILVETKILTETFDIRKDGSLEKPFLKLGKKLGFAREKIKKAIEITLSKEKKLKKGQEEDFFQKINSKKPKILLISHPYNLYDDFVNVGIEKKLKDLGAEAIFIDEVPASQRATSNQQLATSWPEFHWEFGKEIMEKIEEILKYKISGVIEISSFLCGCDAVLKEFVEKSFKEKRVPFLYLIIDEHTADAGVQTRLEAFLDTIK
jgi:predicted nucleotide-binding protein (sugar kinase/HSP70/actin superfamily)